MPAHSLLFSKSTKGAFRPNVPIRQMNRYQQYYISSQHIYCGRVWNLIQACDASRPVASLMVQVGQPAIQEGCQNFVVLHLSRNKSSA